MIGGVVLPELRSEVPSVLVVDYKYKQKAGNLCL